MNDKNRVFYFMGGTLLVALLIIGVMYLSGSRSNGTTTGSKKEVALSSDPTGEIKKAISEITPANVSGVTYTTILTKITAARNQNLINDALQESLQLQLDNQYKSAALTKIDNLVKGDPVNVAEINSVIGHLKSIGVNDPKFSAYQSGIAKMNYFTSTLPGKVSAFTSRSFANYDHNSYKALVNEIESLPGLDPIFRKKSAVVSVQSSSLKKMRDYNAKYAQYQMSLDNIDVNIN